MSKEGKFLIFCMERYRYYKKLSGAQVAEHFEKHHICRSSNLLTLNYLSYGIKKIWLQSFDIRRFAV